MTITVGLDTLIGKVRLLIGDDRPGQGVLPDGANFEDPQIQFFLTEESDDYGAAAAAALENLATRYSVLADLAVGSRRESLSQISDKFAERAVDLRGKYGGGADGVVSAGTIRTDGYSDDKASDEVETTASEYQEHFHYVRPG